MVPSAGVQFVETGEEDIVIKVCSDNLRISLRKLNMNMFSGVLAYSLKCQDLITGITTKTRLTLIQNNGVWEPKLDNYIPGAYPILNNLFN